MNWIRQQGLVTTTLTVSAAAVGGFVLTALASLYLARVLAKPDYGQVAYFANLFSPLLLILGLGLSTNVTTEVARLCRSELRSELDKRIYTLLFLRLVTIAPLPLFGALAAVLSGQLPYLLISVAAMCAILSDFLLGILRGYQRMTTAAWILALQAVIYTGLLFAGLARHVSGIFLALSTSYAGILLLEAVVLFHPGGLMPRFRSLFLSRAYARRALSFSFKVYLIGLCQTAFGSLALILLGISGRYTTAAELSVPLSLVYLLTLVNGPILVTVVYPRVAQGGAVAARTFGIACRLVAALAIPGAAVVAIYPDVVIRLLYTARYMSAVPFLVTLAPLVLILALESLMTLTQIGLGKTGDALTLQAGRLALLGLGSLFVLSVPSAASSAGVWLSRVYLLTGLGGFLWQTYRMGISGQLARMLLVGAGATGAALAIRALGVGGSVGSGALQVLISGVIALGLTTVVYFGRDLYAVVTSRKSEIPVQSDEKPEL